MMPSSASEVSSVGLVTKDLHEELQKNTEVTVAVAVIRALTRVIERSTATTVMGLEKDLHSATVELKESYPTVISVSAASELFLRFVTRTSALDLSDFHALKQHLIDRGNQFAQISSAAKAKIAELGERFLHGGCTVMVLGYSSVMLNLLETAVSKGKFFTVIVAESKPGKEGLRMYKALERAKIQVSMILDAQVAHKLEEVDMVLTGAEAVAESGGIINKIGTYQMSLLAGVKGIPVYVAAESYKFSRLYPMHQRDLSLSSDQVEIGSDSFEVPLNDYTPPENITLLITDLGVLTPAAISDQLIQLYQ
uniref:Translation initiation factor eIF2B subunit alpha n=2 Tax=Eukaryota TaxID=2759 RepID=A0A7S1HR32_9EUKA|mmetsp:Transcript_14424/g.37156  ORF Transcript_14424/g.37156 Transcript_14424/m.37156 type:complete len:309 (+) Transcript_14424:55-981(+)